MRLCLSSNRGWDWNRHMDHLVFEDLTHRPKRRTIIGTSNRRIGVNDTVAKKAPDIVLLP